MPPITSKFWHLDAETRGRADPVRLQTNRYDIVPASFMEVEKVKSIYANCPRPNYRVTGVEVIIVDEDRERGFTNHLRDFRVKKREALISADQAEIEQLFNRMAKSYIDVEHPNVLLLPTWHGTTPDAVFGICERNYEPTASDRVDGGYFGAGIYSTFEADYAHRVYMQGALLLNWTAAGSTYYVLEKDKLHGDTLKYGYDAHFIPVKASTKNSGEYLATKPGSHTYTELVVREKAACLPRYKVDLKPLLDMSINFVERTSLLDQIHSACQAHQMTVIYGSPKIGKSALVNAYVNKYADHFHFIWKIDCQSSEKREQSYQDLAGYLKTPQEILDGKLLDIPEIHERLKNLNTPKPWLLVYDGLEEVIQLPENVHVLITTRKKNLLNEKSIEVPPLSEEEGIELLNLLIHKTKPSDKHKQLIRECGNYPSLLFQVATHIEKTKDLDLKSFLQSPSALDIEAIVAKLSALEEHRLFYQMLSRKENLEHLRTHYLAILEKIGVTKSWIDELSNIPTRSGLRQSTLQQELTLRKYLDEITSTDSSLVKVQSSFWKEPRYLKPHIVELDNQGNILKNYPKAAHNVASGYNGLLHFKQKPTQPLMEYAVFNLTSRLAGSLMPATELVSFEVQGKKYPVLISETIKGISLSDAISNPTQKIDKTQWTWHLLTALLIRPGDGHRSNYILDELNRIFCIDNDFAFVEPVVDKGKVFSDIHIQFFSAVFCLKGDLDQDALSAFCKLDIDAIILAWIEDVIKKEAQYLKLFPDPQEREALYKQEPNPGFKPSIMFQQGTLATIILQYWQLHDYISHALKHGPAVTLDGLLKQLIRLDKNQKVVPIGGHVSRAYANVEAKNLYATLKKIKPTKVVESSLTLDQYQAACFGKPLSFQESEKQEFSPQDAKEELFQTIVKVNSEFAETSTTLSKNFEKCSRSEWVLTAMAHRVQTTTASIVISHCPLLTANRLKPFLHNQLVHLDVRFCSQIENNDIRNLQASCPQLKDLLVSNTERLSKINTWFTNGILEFQNLEQLSISHCANLTTIALKAPRLKVLKITHNNNLVNTDLDAPSLSEIDFRYSNKVILSPSATNSILEALSLNPDNLSHAPQSIRDERDKALEDVKQSRVAFIHLKSAFKNDEEIALAGASKNGIELRWLSPELQANEKFVLSVVSQNGYALRYASPETQANEKVALAAISNTAGAFEYVSPELRANEKFMLAALSLHGSLIKYASFEYVSPELRANEKFMLAALSLHGSLIKYASPELLSNEKFMLNVVSKDGSALQYASDKLRANEKIVLAALNQDYHAFMYVSPEILVNETIMKAFIPQIYLELQNGSSGYLETTFKGFILQLLEGNLLIGSVLKYALSQDEQISKLRSEIEERQSEIPFKILHQLMRLETSSTTSRSNRDLEILLTEIEKKTLLIEQLEIILVRQPKISLEEGGPTHQLPVNLEPSPNISGVNRNFASLLIEIEKKNLIKEKVKKILEVAIEHDNLANNS